MLLALENPFVRPDHPGVCEPKSQWSIFYYCGIYEVKLYLYCGLATSHFYNIPCRKCITNFTCMIVGRRGTGQKLLNEYMGTQFPLRVMKMLWNWQKVLVMQHCEYIKLSFMLQNGYVYVMWI